MRNLFFALILAPAVASCNVMTDPIVGHWEASDASFDFTRDGTWLMSLHQPNALFQGMSGHWSKTEDGRYILVTNPLPLGNTATFTAHMDDSNLMLDMGGQSIRLSRSSGGPASRQSSATPNPQQQSTQSQASAPARTFAYHLVVELNADSPRSAEQMSSELGERLGRQLGDGRTEVSVQSDRRLRVKATGDVDPNALKEIIMAEHLTVLEQMSGP